MTADQQKGSFANTETDNTKDRIWAVSQENLYWVFSNQWRHGSAYILVQQDITLSSPSIEHHLQTALYIGTWVVCRGIHYYTVCRWHPSSARFYWQVYCRCTMHSFSRSRSKFHVCKEVAGWYFRCVAPRNEQTLLCQRSCDVITSHWLWDNAFTSQVHLLCKYPLRRFIYKTSRKRINK